MDFIAACKTMERRGKDDFGYIFNKNHSLGHLKHITKDGINEKEPIVILDSYFMMDGNLTNYNEMKEYLDEKIEFDSDSFLTFKLLNKYGVDVLNKINGSYAMCLVKSDKVIALRDRFGVKPMYYSIINGELILASEIKAILSYKKEAVVDKEGLKELLAMGPSHSKGKTIYKGIYEIPPGYYLEYNPLDGVRLIRYYQINVYDNKLSYKAAVEEVKRILDDSIIQNISSNTKTCALLSGGLDSSIVATISSRYINNLNTFNLDYEDNSEDFKANEFEKSRDKDYAREVSENIKSNHHEILISNDDLIKHLTTVVDLRDAPGMTDIDSSLYYLSSKMSDEFSVGLSGECSDEIFAGYPWFYNKDTSTGFPWIRATSFKEELLNDCFKDLGLNEYVDNEYNLAIKEAPTFGKCEEYIEHQRLCYINLRYFMTNLLDRNDRITSGASIDVRAPFCDYRLVELLYNLPFKYKYRMSTEKKLLRDAYKNNVIKSVVKRKKSPYPKSQSHNYHNRIKNLVIDILDDDSSIINILFNKQKLKSFIE
ncbi:MAG: asparagine synthase (glutamine-hydrolyzing), partial [Acholeplasmatales bacterium]|nr:asparagine synthase (glutamine-hydrolyzing) [Acholeplasmatales bacterium]